MMGGEMRPERQGDPTPDEPSPRCPETTGTGIFDPPAVEVDIMTRYLQYYYSY